MLASTLRHGIRAVLAFALTAAAVPPAAAAAQQPETGTISGRVTDEDGAPLPAVQVMVTGTRLGAVSDDDGAYVITNVPAGPVRVIARQIGRRPQTVTIMVVRGGTATRDFALASDPLTLEAVVVTGTRTPERKIESSTAITTLSAEEIEEREPRNTADVLKAVPGFYIESSGGEVGNNLFARGLPADGSYRYVALLEDGMPVFDATELSFVNADIFVRMDQTIDGIEAVRGGNSALFGSNAPGGVVNFISKTGGPEFGGTLAAVAGTSAMNRYDFNFGGPVTADWSFNVGGFWRYDDGVRHPGFPASRGGQIRGNITRDFDGGFVRLYAKYLNDRNIFYLPVPIQGGFDDEGELTDIGFVEGFPDDGTLTSREGVDLRVPLPRSNGDLVLRLDDGQRQVGGNAQLQVGLDLGGGWSIENRLRYMSFDHQWNAMVPGDLADAATWAQGFVATTPGGATARLTCTNVREDGVPVVFGTAACPTGNGLVSLAGQWHVEVPMTSVADQLQLTRDLDLGGTSHTLTLGSYFSHYTADNRWFFNNILTNVQDQPHFLDLTILNAGGAPVRQVTSNGFRRYLDLFVNGTGNVTVASAFAGDQIAFGDRLRLDLGARFEHNRIRSDVENTGTFDVDTTDAGTGVNYGIGTFDRVNVSFDEWAASVGLNYLLSEQAAVYARGSRGYKMPILSNYLFATDPADPSFPNTPERLLQAEGGLRLGSPRLGVSLVGYWLRIENFPSQDVRIVDGTTTFVSAFVGEARTIGAELEVVAMPVDFFRLTGSVTAQDPKYTDFFETATDIEGNPVRADRSGNRVRRVPRLVADLLGTASFGPLQLRGNWTYVGHRFSNNANTVDLPGFGVLNVGVGLGFANGITLEANALNVTQSNGLTEGNPRLDESLGGLSDIFLARPVLPRTFTAGLRYDF
jgi:outer membrane receptor protein involved in Fe transport